MADSLENQDQDTLVSLGKLMESLSQDPKTRGQLQRLIKTKNPSLIIPELDNQDAIANAVKPVQTELEALRKQLAEKSGEESIRAKRAALKEQGYSEEDVTSIEKLMVEKQIPSHDTAAEHFRMQQKLAVPAPSSVRTMQMPVKGDAIKAAGGIRKWALNEGYAAAADIAAGRVRLQ